MLGVPVRAVLVGLLLAESTVAAEQKLPPFTVSDSIAMTRLTDPNASLEVLRINDFHISPDGRLFAVVVRSGDSSTGKNRYSLLIYDSAEVLSFARSDARTALPKARVLATSETASAEDALGHLAWLGGGSQSLAYLATDPKGFRQVFVVDVRSSRARQLTDHPQDIGAYSITDDARTLMYSARSIPDWRYRNAHGYAVRSEYISELSTKDPAEGTPQWQYFVLHPPDSGTVRKVSLPSSIVPDPAWLSPSGKWAVALEHIKGMPSHWAEYDLLGDSKRNAKQIDGVPTDSDNRLGLNGDNDAFGATSGWLVRFVLVDASNGDVRPLLDTPSNGAGAQQARWRADEHTIVLGPVYLPLAGTSVSERERRRRFQAVTEVAVSEGLAKRITDFPAADSAADIFLGDIELVRGGAVRVSEVNYRTGRTRTESYRKIRDHWEHTRSAPTSALEITVAQDMNTPPDLAVKNPETGDWRVFTDFNPQLRRLAMGHVRLFKWEDRLRREFVGGLVVPSDFSPDHRYPVVVQTYGFRQTSYLVDGPEWMTTAYAARALAGAGIVVLQMPEGPNATHPSPDAKALDWSDYGENPLFVTMLEGAIDALDRDRIVDRDRIGLIGFSRAGMHVHYALAFCRYPIAAATIADSVVATPFSYALMYGSYFPGMLEYESPSLIGAPFWGKGLQLWIERSPAFHLDRIQAALRLEHFGTFPPPFWDTFANLKRHNRPVEMIHIPDATHVLQTPFARYTSQQGNVDWFRFWLKDEEDNAAEKAAQYERWRRLKQQRLEDSRNVTNSDATQAPLSVGRAPVRAWSQ